MPAAVCHAPRREPGSTRETASPRCAQRHATAVPMAPAPRTTTSLDGKLAPSRRHNPDQVRRSALRVVRSVRPLSPPRCGLPCCAHPTLAPVPALADARLYLCVDSRARQRDLEQFLDAVLANGVDVVQLREKGLEAREEIRLLEIVAAAAERHGALWAVNDRADVARAVGAPVLHLGQDDLPVPIARAIVGEDVVIGRSTHSPAQADAARTEAGVGYYCCGPTWTTPTKPGRPAAGLELLDHATAGPDDRPWFAIGGIETLDRLDEVIRRGARRAVVVRAITEAEDPGAAARAFADRLRG